MFSSPSTDSAGEQQPHAQRGRAAHCDGGPGGGGDLRHQAQQPRPLHLLAAGGQTAGDGGADQQDGGGGGGDQVEERVSAELHLHSVRPGGHAVLCGLPPGLHGGPRAGHGKPGRSL